METSALPVHWVLAGFVAHQKGRVHAHHDLDRPYYYSIVQIIARINVNQMRTIMPDSVIMIS